MRTHAAPNLLTRGLTEVDKGFQNLPNRTTPEHGLAGLNKPEQIRTNLNAASPSDQIGNAPQIAPNSRIFQNPEHGPAEPNKPEQIRTTPNTADTLYTVSRREERAWFSPPLTLAERRFRCLSR